MKARHLSLFKDSAGEWRWRVTAANGEIVADSDEGYANRVDCARMALSLFGTSVSYDLRADDDTDE